ncbi:hypothetical protein D3C87_1272120 [compost metagenome]
MVFGGDVISDLFVAAHPRKHAGTVYEVIRVDRLCQATEVHARTLRLRKLIEDVGQCVDARRVHVLVEDHVVTADLAGSEFANQSSVLRQRVVRAAMSVQHRADVDLLVADTVTGDDLVVDTATIEHRSVPLSQLVRVACDVGLQSHVEELVHLSLVQECVRQCRRWPAGCLRRRRR